MERLLSLLAIELSEVMTKKSRFSNVVTVFFFCGNSIFELTLDFIRLLRMYFDELDLQRLNDIRSFSG